MTGTASGSRRTIVAAAIVATAVLVLGPLIFVERVPGGSLGVVRNAGPDAAALGPGFHLVSPLRPVDVYPIDAVTIERSAPPESAYSLRAAVDPARAASLPPSGSGGTEALRGMIERIVEEALSNRQAAGIDPETRVRMRLAESGLRVESLTLGPATAEETRRNLDHPIVLVGLDGVDWQILDPLIGKGLVPNLAALKERSAWGHLRSFEPILSPLLWTTAVTGKPPDEHGIIDFLVRDPETGRKLPITSRSRRVRALWNILSEADLTTDLIAWWASWPAEGIRGRVVSDRVAYSLFDVDDPEGERAGLTSPEALWDRLGPRVVDDDSIGHDRVARFLDVTPEEFAAARGRIASDREEAYKEPTNHLTKILASTDTYHAIALEMLSDGQPDLFAVYYQGIDEVCHRFAHFAPPRMEMVTEEDFGKYSRAVEAFYVYQDELLGELLSAVSPDSRVIVLSDHGFQYGPSRPTDVPADIEGKPGKWHRLYGVIMIAGPGIPPGRLDTATLHDVTPTVLALAGMPLADDMKGRPLIERPGSAARRIATYERTDADSPAIASGEDGGNESRAADEELLRNLASLGYIGGGSIGAESVPAGAEPGTITAHTNMASLLMQKGDLDGAEDELEGALARHPDYFPALMMLSQVQLKQGRVGEALESIRKAVTLTADAEHGAYLQLALLAIRAGEAPQAINFLHELGRRRPEAAGIETALGILSLEGGSGDRAEEHFRRALKLDPASPEAMGRLFQLYRERGREADLEAEMRRGLELNDRSVLHHNWLGLILARKGDLRGAETEYRRALELAPDFGGTMINLGSLYGRSGRLEEAVQILSRAIRIEPRNLEARVNLGAALGKLGRLDDAIASMEEARGLGVRSPAMLNAVGLAYAQKGETRKAIEALEESLTMSPEQPEVRSLLQDLSGSTRSSRPAR